MKIVLLIIFICVIFLCFTGYRVMQIIIKKGNRSRPAQVIDALCLVLLVIGLGILAYGYFVEPTLLQTTHITLQSPKIVSGESIVIAQFSDLHAPLSPTMYTKIVMAIAMEKPDLIIFTGDMADNKKGYDEAIELLNQLTPIAPLFVIKGNNDDDSDDHYFDPCNVVELNGQMAKVKIGKTTIQLTGASQQKSWGLIHSILRNRNSSLYTIYAGHSPDSVNDISKWGADLYLCGHTHGGQICIPFYGAVWTASYMGKQAEKGRSLFDETVLYVNRGIGMTPIFLPIRIGAVPEISIFTIQSP